MSSPCEAFRTRLERTLAGRPEPQRLGELGWHEHLLGCADCRELLESEQALEELLATLPAPRLPRDLHERVLARLRSDRRDDLDTLLELDEPEPAPAGLARSVLDGLAERRVRHAAHGGEETRLERLLDLLPEPEVPVGLAARTLRALKEERGRDVRPAWRRMLPLAAAVLVALLAGLWGALALRRAEPGGGEPLVAEGGSAVGRPSADEAPEEELLAALDVLEDWDVLMSEDVELYLAAFEQTALDGADPALLLLEEDLWLEGDEEPEAEDTRQG